VSFASDAGRFLIETLFGMYLLVVMLRFLMQFVRADFRNPISQFIFKATNPPLIPMRRVIPGLFGIDLSSVVLMLILQLIEIYLVRQIFSYPISFSILTVLTIVNLLQLLIYVYLFSILIQVILSWVNPGGYNPAIALVYALNQPILSRAQRLLPPIGGFDLSPILPIIVLQLMNMALSHIKAPYEPLRMLISG
jgi:YggT family protein